MHKARLGHLLTPALIVVGILGSASFLFLAMNGAGYTDFPEQILEAMAVLLAALVFATEFSRAHLDTLSERVVEKMNSDQNRVLAAHAEGHLTTIQLMDVANLWFARVHKPMKAVSESLPRLLRRQRLYNKLHGSKGKVKPDDWKRLSKLEGPFGTIETRAVHEQLQGLREALLLIATGRLAISLVGLVIFALAMIGAGGAGWRFSWPPSPSWWAVSALVGVASLYIWLSMAALNSISRGMTDDLSALPLYRLLRAEVHVPNWFPTEESDAIMRERALKLSITNPLASELLIRPEWETTLNYLLSLETTHPYMGWVHSLRGRYLLYTVLRSYGAGSWRDTVKLSRFHLNLAAKEGDLLAEVGLAHIGELEAGAESSKEFIHTLSLADAESGRAAREFLRGQKGWLAPLSDEIVGELLSLAEDPTAQNEHGEEDWSPSIGKHCQLVEQRAKREGE